VATVRVGGGCTPSPSCKNNAANEDVRAATDVTVSVQRRGRTTPQTESPTVDSVHGDGSYINPISTPVFVAVSDSLASRDIKLGIDTECVKGDTECVKGDTERVKGDTESITRGSSFESVESGSLATSTTSMHISVAAIGNTTGTGVKRRVDEVEVVKTEGATLELVVDDTTVDVKDEVEQDVDVKDEVEEDVDVKDEVEEDVDVKDEAAEDVDVKNEAGEKGSKVVVVLDAENLGLFRFANDTKGMLAIPNAMDTVAFCFSLSANSASSSTSF
jgi:hypothetical protein